MLSTLKPGKVQRAAKKLGRKLDNTYGCGIYRASLEGSEAGRQYRS